MYRMRYISIQQELGHGGAVIGPESRRERQRRGETIAPTLKKGFIYERIAAVREPRPHRVDVPVSHGNSDCPGDIRIHLRRRAARASGFAICNLQVLIIFRMVMANCSWPQKSDSANRSLENRKARRYTAYRLSPCVVKGRQLLVS